MAAAPGGGYSADDERKVSEWIQTVIAGRVSSAPGPLSEHLQRGGRSFHEWLQSGVVLCELVNALQPGTITKKVKISSTAFVCRSNIDLYVRGCKALGLGDPDCFETRDLFDGQNMKRVIDNVYAVSAASRNIASFSGPYIGVAHAQENRREFSEAQMRAGLAAVPKWTTGDKQVDTASKHDSYGIVVAPGLTHHSGGAGQGVWDGGSIARDTSSQHDSYGIVRNKDVTTHSGVQSSWERGAIAVDTSSKHDSYGIVRNADVTTHSGVQSTWERGAIPQDTGSKHDSYGVVRQPEKPPQ